MNLRSLRLLRWLDDPMPGLVWEYEPGGALPGIHPDDLSIAMRMASGLPRGKTSGVIRLRFVDGSWRATPITANLDFLDHNTTVALVTLATNKA